MQLQLHQQNGSIVLSHQGELTIYGAVEFRDAVLKAMRGEGDLRIDLSGATEMDAAGLQLLLLAKREADTCGKRLLLAATSPVVDEVLQLCNVAGWFEAAPGAAA